MKAAHSHICASKAGAVIHAFWQILVPEMHSVSLMNTKPSVGASPVRRETLMSGVLLVSVAVIMIVLGKNLAIRVFVWIHVHQPVVAEMLCVMLRTIRGCADVLQVMRETLTWCATQVTNLLTRYVVMTKTVMWDWAALMAGVRTCVILSHVGRMLNVEW